MKITILRYTFVGNWAFSPSVIEIKDNIFCKSLFDNPAITTAGNANINTNGVIVNTFFIATQPQLGSIVTNNVVTINQQQLQIISNDIDLISTVIERLKSKLLELNTTQFKFAFMSNTLGIDLEVGDFYETEKLSSKWLSEKFVEKNLNIIDNFKPSEIHLADLKIIIQKENNQKIGMLIQPRANKEKYLFITTTEEFHTSDSQSIEEEIKSRINNLSIDSLAQIKKIIND